MRFLWSAFQSTLFQRFPDAVLQQLLIVISIEPVLFHLQNIYISIIIVIGFSILKENLVNFVLRAQFLFPLLRNRILGLSCYIFLVKFMTTKLINLTPRYGLRCQLILSSPIFPPTSTAPESLRVILFRKDLFYVYSKLS